MEDRERERESEQPRLTPQKASDREHHNTLSSFQLHHHMEEVVFFTTEALAECRGSASSRQQTGRRGEEGVNV